MHQSFSIDVLQVTNLTEDRHQEDSQLVIVVDVHVLDQLRLETRVSHAQMLERCVFYVRTFTVLLSHDSGCPTAAKEQRNFTKHVTSAQVLFYSCLFFRFVRFLLLIAQIPHVCLHLVVASHDEVNVHIIFHGAIIVQNCVILLDNFVARLVVSHLQVVDKFEADRFVLSTDCSRRVLGKQGRVRIVDL